MAAARGPWVLSSHNVGVVGCLWEAKKRAWCLSFHRTRFCGRQGVWQGLGQVHLPAPLFWLYPWHALSVVDPHSVLWPWAAALAPQVAMAKSCPPNLCTSACVTAQGHTR